MSAQAAQVLWNCKKGNLCDSQGDFHTPGKAVLKALPGMHRTHRTKLRRLLRNLRIESERAGRDLLQSIFVVREFAFSAL